jgi:2,4-dienoyl-CoA reductase-like NADH-dependent reductase (Old Yellow Enzyme family)
LERFLKPLTCAGIDAYHCSTRRFWDPEFAGSSLNLAGWTKKLSGKPTITVGSVTLSKDVTETVASADAAATTGIDELLSRLEREEFDLVAIGRSLIANPDWAVMVRGGAVSKLRSFQRDMLSSLI